MIFLALKNEEHGIGLNYGGSKVKDIHQCFVFTYIFL